MCSSDLFLGLSAARLSGSGVGIGIQAKGTAVIHQRDRLPHNNLELFSNAPITTLDARDAKVPPRFQVKAPAGAPNVLIVLIDDVGFGLPDTFGGEVHTPTLTKLRNEGLCWLKYPLIYDCHQQ